MGRLALLLVTVMALSGCAGGPTLSARHHTEIQALKASMAAQRARYTEVAALTQITSQSNGKVALWPAFTAVVRHHPPLVELNGFTEMGFPLFTYRASNGQYQFDLASGDQHLSGKVDGRWDVTGRLLNDASHLLDGVLGVEIADATLRPTGDGGWRFKDAGVTTRFKTVNGQLVELSRDRRGHKPSQIRFDDFRWVGASLAPHRITVDLKEYQLTLTIIVEEWVLSLAEGG